jgi:phosphoesterase RecJ-like protein
MDKSIEKSKKLILDAINRYTNFAILISDPDGDAVGSGLALEEMLSQMGKKVKLFSSYKLDDFSYAPRFKKFTITDIAKLDFGQFGCVITLDSGDYNRVLDRNYRFIKIKPPNKPLINIDHHKSNTKFGTINYVDKKASSTSEELYDIFRNKIEISKTIATNLLIGIVGDTGAFKYNNTTSHILNIAAKLLQKGADHQYVIKNAFYSTEKNVFKMNKEAIQTITMKKINDIEYAYAIVDGTKYGIPEPHREQRYIVQTAIQSIKDLDFTVTLTKVTDTYTKLSFRSNASKFPVRIIAEHFNGGGHDVAAGGTTQMNIENTLKALEEYLSEYKDSKKS